MTGIDFEIYTLGNGYYLEKIFTMVATVCKNGGGIMGIMKFAALSSAALLAVRVSLGGGSIKETLKWAGGIIAFLSIFMQATATIYINDGLADITNAGGGRGRIVKNVPYGLAYIASTTSSVGEYLRKNVEQGMAMVTNNSSYAKYGVMFGSKIVEDANNARVQDPYLSAGLNEFFHKCIIPDFSMGRARTRGYTVADLKATNNIDQFLKDHASRARPIDMSQLAPLKLRLDAQADASKPFTFNWDKEESQVPDTMPSYLSCNKAWTDVISPYLNGEAENNKFKYFASFIGMFSSRDTTVEEKNRILDSMLSDVYGVLRVAQEQGRSATEILKQSLLINSFKTSASTGLADVIAREKTKATYQSLALNAQRFIPIVRSTFEGLFYGLFPLILILLVTPIGFSVLSNYAFGFVYLQMWAPLYAILYSISGAWAESSLMKLSHSAQGISNIEAVNTDISLFSGYMMALVPFIALGLTKGLSSAVGGLVTRIGSVQEANAVSASDEMVRGNMSLGNTNIGNTSAFNDSRNKEDTNFMKSFGMRGTNIDGVIEQHFSDGGGTYDRSGRDHKFGSLESGLSLTSADGQNISKSYEASVSNTKTKDASWIRGISSIASDHHSSGKSSNEQIKEELGINRSLNNEETKNYEQMMKASESYSKNHGVTIDKGWSNTFSGNIGAKLGGKLPGIGKFLPVSGDVGVGVSVKGTSGKQNKDTTGFSQDVNANTYMNAGKKLLDSLSKVDGTTGSNAFVSTKDHTKSAAFNDRVEANNSVIEAHQESERLSKSLTNFNNSSLASKVDLDQDYFNWGFNKYGRDDFIARNIPTENRQAMHAQYKSEKFPGISNKPLPKVTATDTSEIGDSNRTRVYKSFDENKTSYVDSWKDTDQRETKVRESHHSNLESFDNKREETGASIDGVKSSIATTSQILQSGHKKNAERGVFRGSLDAFLGKNSRETLETKDQNFKEGVELNLQPREKALPSQRITKPLNEDISSDSDSKDDDKKKKATAKENPLSTTKKGE